MRAIVSFPELAPEFAFLARVFVPPGVSDAARETFETTHRSFRDGFVECELSVDARAMNAQQSRCVRDVAIRFPERALNQNVFGIREVQRQLGDRCRMCDG